MKIGPNKVCFTNSSHTVPFMMTVDEGGFLGIDDYLLCLHFDIQHGPLVLVVREEYDEDMVFIRTVYQRPRFSDIGVFYRIIPGFYKVQWVGESVTPVFVSKNTGAKSTPFL